MEFAFSGGKGWRRLLGPSWRVGWNRELLMGETEVDWFRYGSSTESGVNSNAMAPRQNITGFDPQKFAASAGIPANDPWKRAEAWRYTGPFTRWNRLKGAFPGLGVATVAFGVYLAYEAVSVKDEHHGDSHGSDHH
ncbi:hypothetical protein M8818_002462 [Zalaria obscura]|uniref:Uncharacterized protein n=1 Tax=Zalaria obscura TaxID=2024903 RepID=A0ACC3SHX0_9PEZI